MVDTPVLFSGTCHIAVGSNIMPEENIPRALDLLHRQLTIVAVSTFYHTPAINRPEQDDYLNGAITVRYTGSLRDLKYAVLRRVEAAAGRKRQADPWAARTIDFDIALCEDIVLNESGLVIPDPDIRGRPFLAAAILELEPELVMPDSRMPLKCEIDMNALSQLTPADAFSKALKERYCL